MSLRKLAIATLAAIAALKTTALPVAGAIEGGHKGVTELTDFLVPDSITATTVAARDTTSSTAQGPAPGVSGIDIVVIVLAVCGLIAAVFVFVYTNFCDTCFCDTCCVKKRIGREAEEARKERERVREVERSMAQRYGYGFVDVELGPMPEQPMCSHPPRYTTTDPGQPWAGPS
ncbi:hypothetical protein GGTG_05708 [Gaeumannomyces tritici R3-111a-1]|uniref:Uncharacterized protein n=1 Tax=Gaeumannomyces tritici (strain R3-111a-1) TaxID=644352 RepID=J3NWP6_GAET3|nr:hypothetical protein GGTG_05708 [Gaeumannomyces tritici R3-111a-1]EJT75778.1 hypothetical protein GGTG_05708 [Gaeumannomyces tritici R3-111a-1]